LRNQISRGDLTPRRLIIIIIYYYLLLADKIARRREGLAFLALLVQYARTRDARGSTAGSRRDLHFLSSYISYSAALGGDLHSDALPSIPSHGT